MLTCTSAGHDVCNQAVSSPFARRRFGGFWRSSQQQRSDFFHWFAVVESFAGSVVEFGGDVV